jgi:hypothetical protein
VDVLVALAVEGVRKLSKFVTFTSAFVMHDNAVVVAGSGDELEPFTPYTRIFQLNQNNPPYWWAHDEEWRVCSFTYFGSEDEGFDDSVVLSEEGHVQYLGEHDPILEKIPGAGSASSPDSQGWGYLSDIQQIGDHLYAAGFRGQVYKRLGPNQWVHMDEGILQVSPRIAKEAAEPAYSIQVINGPHENAIYIAGCTHLPYYPVRASFWNGQVWQDLQLPDVAERITNIYVESEQRIWMCGANGTLLLGNAYDGFKSLSTVDDNQLFLSLCKFENKIYLGSNIGLFIYDPADHNAGIQKVKTNLVPNLQDANIVDCYETVLWSIGPKDIAKYDGSTWQRIHHPDNPKIG